MDVLLPTQCGPVLSHDDPHWSDDLLGHRGRHGGGIQGAVGVATEVVDQLLDDGKKRKLTLAVILGGGALRVTGVTEVFEMHSDELEMLLLEENSSTLLPNHYQSYTFQTIHASATSLSFS